MPAQINEWIAINDFRAGIKNRTSPASGSDRPEGHALGEADAGNTYRCWAIPNGSLVPMPDMTFQTQAFGASTPLNPTLTRTGRLAIVGFKVVGPVGTTQEHHVAFEAVKTSDNKRYFYWMRVKPDGTFETIKSFAPVALEGALGAGLNSVRPCFFDTFRANASVATSPGVPGVTAAWYAGAGDLDQVWHMFPNPSTPTSSTPLQIGSGTGLNPDQALSHQGRAVAFDSDAYGHGAGGFVWQHNENVWFTKANLTTMDVTVAQTFGAENASGYNAAVSHNHQELFLVKNSGGAVLIRGDIKNPTVLRLPGIPRVSHHVPCVTPLGVTMFDAQYGGAWLWNGGESADQISRDAMDLGAMGLGVGGTSGPATDFVDYTGNCAFWYNFVLFPNNWVWDWQQNAWWRLENPATVQFMHYSVFQQKLWAAPPSITATTDIVYYGAQLGTPCTTYRWKSMPIPVGAPNQEAIIREFVVVATGIGDITITFTDTSGATEAHTFSISSTAEPTVYRDNAAVNCQHVQVQIDVTGTGTAIQTPTIHELRMGVGVQAHYPLRTR